MHQTDEPRVNTPKPDISLVIPTYNRMHLLQQALQSVARSRIANRDQVEVLVVDNGSTDATHNAVERLRENGFPFRLRYFFEPAQGVSHSRNRGIAASYGNYIVFMDDDQVIDPTYLDRVKPAFEKLPVACMGGAVVFNAPADIPPSLAPMFETLRTYMSREQLTNLRTRLLAPDEYLGSGNMVVKRRDLCAVGCFDTSLGRRGNSLMGGEEDALQDRLRAAGKTIAFDPALIQYHHFAPELVTKRYWRKRQLDYGRTLYIRHESWQDERSPRWFGAPRWMWSALITADLPRLFEAIVERDAVQRFQCELHIRQRLGMIHQARLASTRSQPATARRAA